MNNLKDYGVLFAMELGKLKGTEVELDIDPNAIPKFVKAHPVPFSLRLKVDQEFDRLLKAGIIEPVQFSRWAAPIVPVMKGDCSVWICGNYKVTVNLATRSDTYPIRCIDELFTKLSLDETLHKARLDPHRPAVGFIENFT